MKKIQGVKRAKSSTEPDNEITKEDPEATRALGLSAPCCTKE